MYKILKNTIEMDDYSVQKLSNQPPEPFEWNTVEGTELSVSDCMGGKGKIEVKGNTEQATSILPEEYTQVDYIESHGTEYIDTGVNADYKLSFKAKMKFLNTTQKFMGALKADGTNYVRHHFDGNTNSNVIYYMDKKNVTIAQFDNDIHEYNIDAYNKLVNIDGGSNIALNYETNFDTELNYYICARNKNIQLTQQDFVQMQVYAFKMYTAGVLVRDFIPCYRNSDNVVGLYDLVNGVFYENQGSRAFTFGSIVAVPNPDYPQDIEVVTGNNVVKHVGKNIAKSYVNSNARYRYSDSLYVDAKFEVGKKYVISFVDESVGNAYYRNEWFMSNVSSYSITASGQRQSYYFECKSNDKTKSRTYVEGKGYVIFKNMNELSILPQFKDIQVEEVESYDVLPTPYEQYKEKEYELTLGNMELCKIGDYSDILFKNVIGDENYNAELESGAWYKKKNIEKLVINGGFQSAGVSNVFYSNRITDYAINNNIPYCEYFKGINNVAAASGMANVDFNTIAFINISGSTTPRCYIKANKTQSELNTFLAENTPHLYYLLETPTYTKITNPTLISQLESLRKAKWFKGVNHWWTETENLKPILKGTYRQAINE